MPRVTTLRVPAIEVEQTPNRRVYSFAIDGKMIHDFVAVSRIRRNGEAEIEGYQRPEVLSHIEQIKTYVESDDPVIPNALVVAFDNRVKFKPYPSGKKAKPGNKNISRAGELHIPVNPKQANDKKPGWLVDGQQRAAAIRNAKVTKFPICVTAFITDSAKEQRTQFILVNSTKPLPKGLIYELLPSTEGRLPSLLQRRKFPAYLVARLNNDEDSPLKGLIKTPTNGDGIIKDNSVLKMLENSLTDGALYRYRDPFTGEGDVEAMLELERSFWFAVNNVFAEAWGLPPRRSRLMHGAGIVSMGYLKDAITDRLRSSGAPTTEAYKKDLLLIKEECRWTHGFWDFGPGEQMKWNEVQNTPRHIQLLSNYLLVVYRQAAMDV
ncbi:DGQHR domain-containing protein DpdB [Myxococcota bacterium]